MISISSFQSAIKIESLFFLWQASPFNTFRKVWKGKVNTLKIHTVPQPPILTAPQNCHSLQTMECKVNYAFLLLFYIYSLFKKKYQGTILSTRIHIEVLWVFVRTHTLDGVSRSWHQDSILSHLDAGIQIVLIHLTGMHLASVFQILSSGHRCLTLVWILEK